MKLTLKIWRQKSSTDKGSLETYPISEVSEHMSFLEMLDVLNEDLIEKGIEPAPEGAEIIIALPIKSLKGLIAHLKLVL